MKEGILSTIGRTPLIRIKRMYRRTDIQVFAKLEAFNPGGSSKDRTAMAIIMGAMERKEIGKDTVVIESSSGNMAIGLAQVCKYLGLRFICVVDDRTTQANLQILRAYGATIDVVRQQDVGTGNILEARIRRVQELLRDTPNSYWTNQYANEDNGRAHQKTMHELVVELEGKLDYVFCATSTCGTLRGCAEYVRASGLSTKIIAVDAVGSVIFGGVESKRLLPGHGAGRRPELHEPWLASQFIHINDQECVVGCRLLMKREAILAGGSSGATTMALRSMLDEIPPGSRCVLIFPDRGERYVDTIFSDVWVEEHFGDISHLWDDEALSER